jgi:hypothetical protein
MIRLVMPIGKSLTDLYRTVTIYHLLTCSMYYLFLSSPWISVEYFGKSENFHFIALYCVLFWENRKLPLCCCFILCVFYVGTYSGIPSRLFGLPWNISGNPKISTPLHFIVYFFGKTENFHFVVDLYFVHSVVATATSPKVCL